MIEGTISDDVSRERIAGLAEATAIALAAASGVSIRALHGAAEMEAASELLDKIWKVEGNKTPIDPGLLVALSHSHNYVAGAYRGQEMVAVCVGFFHPPPERALHSHIAGVIAGSAGAGVGRALKHHERAWCLRRGTDTMTWTFDPLVARNAYFNIHRLGTAAVKYLPNFYGTMTDSINQGSESDRMLVKWDLLREPGVTVSDRVTGTQPEALVLHDDDGVPCLHLNELGAAVRVRVEIPSDIEAMRIEHPDQASLWRPALRDAIAPLMNDGWRITDFARPGHYSLERTPTRAHSQR